MPADSPSRAARSLLAVVAALAAVSVPDVGGADPAGSLHSQARGLEAQNDALAARSHAAVLEMYALEARLAQAQARAAALQDRAAAVRRERQLVRHRLGVARQTVAAAERGLAQRLRLLYERDEVDPLAVILGAESLDDAITGLDAIERAADQDRGLASEARQARTRLRHTARVLGARERVLDRLESAAQAAAASLDQARRERATSIARLAAQQRLNRSQIDSLDRRAKAAEASSRSLMAAAAPSPPAPVATSPPAPVASPATSPGAAPGDRRLTVIATAYSLPGRTASGLPTGPGVVATDPAVIPLGTRMTIPGYGEGIAADTGSAIKGNRIDVWFPTLAQAQAWGAKTVTITVHGG